MTIHKKIARNTIIQVIGRIINTLLGVFAIGLISRYLGQSGFGQFTIIFVVVQLAGILSDFGLYIIALTHIATSDGKWKNPLSQITILRFFLSLGAFVVTTVVVWFLPYESMMKIGIIVLASSNIFISLTQTVSTIFQRDLATKKMVFAECVHRIVMIACVWLFIWMERGLLAIVSALVYANIAQFAITLILAQKHSKFEFIFQKKYIKHVIKQTWPVSVAIVFGLIFFKADTLILSFFHSQEVVGIYGISYRILETLIAFPMLFAALILPQLAKSISENDWETFENFFQTGFDTLAAVSIPMVAGTLVLATPIVRLIAGPAFDASGPLLQVLIIASFFIFFNSLFMLTNVALHKQYTMMKCSILVAVVSLTGYMLFIPSFAAQGAAWMTLVTELLSLSVSAIIFWRTRRSFPNFRIFQLSLLSSIGMAGLLAFLPSIHVIGRVAVGSVFYFFLMYLFGAIPKNIFRMSHALET